ncbi:type IV pilin N-terminal domain-containing protein [Halorubrum ezzemoulense]|uniref:type IV pilin N-terminal domain-containing protein n=1 Tax=Halorubrum ezzemoulense TaxID=337243 RepID=UPI00232CD9C3|nr:type IV pilin N-terminal domain-containing protein [Halorubrum ezzemoulense]MDB9295817.1 type IV pilin N-terminal domain-containing protein [Halorubrum ezzemoulense]
MKLSNQFNGEDRAVSPVIGVILMVAITVILAAVIGTFVLGLGDQIGGSATAGVAVDGDSVTLSNMGTADYVLVNSSSGTLTNGNLSSVGDSVSFSSSDTPIQIIAVADGEKTLLRTVD